MKSSTWVWPKEDVVCERRRILFKSSIRFYNSVSWLYPLCIGFHDKRGKDLFYTLLLRKKIADNLRCRAYVPENEELTANAFVGIYSVYTLADIVCLHVYISGYIA